MQLQVLVPQVEYLRTHHPEERVFLAGHSAGGVLARLYMVTHPKVPVAALITIASPHLGTGAAELGLMAGDSSLGFLAPLVAGSTLNRSAGAVCRPGTTAARYSARLAELPTASAGRVYFSGARRPGL